MAVIAAYAVPHPPLILPEVGRGQERGIQSTIDGYHAAAARFADDKAETVVVVSPHSTMYADYFHISPGSGASGDMAGFGVKGPKTTIGYDEAFVEALEKAASKKKLPAGRQGEKSEALDHGCVVPLRFFQEAWDDFRVVRIGLSGLSAQEHYQLGQCIQEVAETTGRRTVLIASGDLSHRLKSDGPYGFAPEGPEFDRQVMEALGAGDFLALMRMDPLLCERAGECGWRAFVIMAGAFDGRQVAAKSLSYEGPFGVGYGICAFSAGDTDANRQIGKAYARGVEESMTEVRQREDVYIRLARHSLEEYILHGKRLKGIEDLPADLSRNLPDQLTRQRAGAFVSLKIEGRLRGCIGTISPVQPTLLGEILHNAVSAAVEDPRFNPVEEKELAQLSVSVDVLGQPEPIDSMDALDVQRYGVIVSHGYKRGLLLPDLEGVDTAARQVEIAKQKAGIVPGESFQMERFEVIRHEVGHELRG
ncbi:MAG: AmmeMemoRadiSam system protein A [Clostridiales bacterium]|nr:AmmeMemoRadiSam system protein A [Clostridiales bacterium]